MLSDSTTKTIKKQWKTFSLELFNCIFLFFLFLPMCTYLNDYLKLEKLMWLYHFIAVFLIDIITNGAILNPAMTIALYINGNISFDKTITLSLAQYIAGPISFLLLELCVPILKNKIKGPDIYKVNDIINNIVIKDAYYEGIGMLIFTVVVLASAKYLKSANMNRGIAAITLRVLAIFSEKTGAWLNPMMAFGWVIFSAGFSIDNQIISANNPTLFVFCLAPNIGACIGAMVFALLEYMMIPPVAIDVEKVMLVKPTVRPSDLLSPRNSIYRINGDTPTPLKTPRRRAQSPSVSLTRLASSPTSRAKSPSSKRSKSPSSKKNK